MSPAPHAPPGALLHGPFAFAGPGLLALGLFLMFAEPNTRADEAPVPTTTVVAANGARAVDLAPASVDSLTFSSTDGDPIRIRAPRRTDARQLAIAR